MVSGGLGYATMAAFTNYITLLEEGEYGQALLFTQKLFSYKKYVTEEGEGSKNVSVE